MSVAYCPHARRLNDVRYEDSERGVTQGRCFVCLQPPRSIAEQDYLAIPAYLQEI